MGVGDGGIPVDKEVTAKGDGADSEESLDYLQSSILDEEKKADGGLVVAEVVLGKNDEDNDGLRNEFLSQSLLKSV